ncbi:MULTISPECIES: hypothetical protein [Acinetobacter]|uniref:Uncharacterized protein n=1 Tax=Acinetobacter piscicola TaxID=2006115 RepID=A0A7S7AH84_9GAMM|nr:MULTISPECIES: hypothetical protein [Acinetobacter]QOW45847.1 hypothetical protein G0028_08045 [Acinetobacter piscicola]
MSKLGCLCGHVIRDQTDYIPYKASFISDKLDFAMLDELEKRIEMYKLKMAEGKKLPDYYLYDSLSGVDINFRKHMYECVNCGRIWLQTTENNFKSYLSETGQYEAVLDVDNIELK